MCLNFFLIPICANISKGLTVLCCCAAEMHWLSRQDDRNVNQILNQIFTEKQ